jgi:hypothetical protein
MKPNDIIIDPEIRALIPPLREEERALLEESLRTEGCRDPLVAWKGHNILLDGHNRKEICERLGLEYAVTEIALPDRDAACDWVDANQLGRRNLTPDQMSLLRGRRYNRQKKAASFEKGERWGGNPGGKANSVGDHFDPPQKTADSLARQHGVSSPTIRRDGKYAEAVEKATEVEPDLPGRIAKGKAPPRKAVVDAARMAKTDPEGAKQILAETTKRPARSGSANAANRSQADGTPKKQGKKFDTGPRYLAILMAVSRELSRIQRIDLSEAEKADFREKVMNCLEDQLRRN